MRRKLSTVVLGLTALAFAGTEVAAQTGTGLNTATTPGGVLYDLEWWWAAGAYDPTINSLADLEAPGQVVVEADQPSTWFDSDPDEVPEEWISVSSSGHMDGSTFTFYHFFNIGPGQRIDGFWSSDNTSNLFLDDVLIAVGPDPTWFTSAHPYSGATRDVNNVLAIEVTNLACVGCWPNPGAVILGVTNVSPVPEPGTLALLGTGLVSLFGVAYRRRNREVSSEE